MAEGGGDKLGHPIRHACSFKLGERIVVPIQALTFGRLLRVVDKGAQFENRCSALVVSVYGIGLIL